MTEVVDYSFTPSETRNYYIRSTGTGSSPDPFVILCHAGDYAYIMLISNERLGAELPAFYTPDDFIGYLQALGVTCLPGRSILYKKLKSVSGFFPDWAFRDKPGALEVMRRKYVASQFLRIFYRAKRQGVDEIVDKMTNSGRNRGHTPKNT